MTVTNWKLMLARPRVIEDLLRNDLQVELQDLPEGPSVPIDRVQLGTKRLDPRIWLVDGTRIIGNKTYRIRYAEPLTEKEKSSREHLPDVLADDPVGGESLGPDREELASIIGRDPGRDVDAGASS